MVLYVFRGLLFALWYVRWVIDRFLGVAGIVVSGRLGGDSVRGVQSRKAFSVRGLPVVFRVQRNLGHIVCCGFVCFSGSFVCVVVCKMGY